MAGKSLASKGLGARAMAMVRELYNHYRKNPDEMKQVVQDFPEKLRANGNRVSFRLQITAMYYALRDPKTPIRVKATLAAAIAYFIMPLDLIPDWLIGVGFADDLTVVMMVLRQLSGSVTETHYELARRRLQGEQEST